MSIRQKNEDPWQYATYEGAERLQRRQTAKMSFSQRLQALDDMIRLARALKRSGKKKKGVSWRPGYRKTDCSEEVSRQQMD